MCGDLEKKVERERVQKIPVLSARERLLTMIAAQLSTVYLLPVAITIL